MTTSHQFQIEQLRAHNLHKTLEALLVMLGALFVTALLPSLLIRYVYANQQLLEEPRALQVIPAISFAVGLGYALYVLITNFLRERKAAQLEAQMMHGDQKVTSTKSTASDLQVALSRIESAPSRTKTSKSAAKTTRAKKTARRK
jgi:hypothetical protein